MLRHTTGLSWGVRALFIFLACVLLTLCSAQASFAHQSSVSARDFAIPGGSDPWGTALDHNGNVWLFVPGCDPNPTCSSSTAPGKIEEFNAASSYWMRTVQLPAAYGQAFFGAFDGAGNLWFPAPMSNALAMYNPSNGSFSQWKVPTSNALPWDVAIDQQGNIWFTEHGSNKIGRFSASSHTFKEVATQASNSQPYGIVVDSHDNIWFTENNAAVARIGKYSSGGTLKEYKIRNSTNSGLTPHLITVDHNGNIWWSEGWVGAIGKLNVSQAAPGTNNGVKEYFYPRTCGSCSTHTSGISVDGSGNVWFDDALQNIYGSFNISSGKFSVYNTPTSNAHPHDGLRATGNTIWFDEEFVNKLAKATE
jgi:streptogramin lyase